MEASKVYYTDFRCPVGTSLLDKLRRVCIAAGIKDIDMDGKFVAIKMHFGELGNLGFLRPNYAKAVADVVKELGGIPFLTDCNTLYPGSRKNAIERTCRWRPDLIETARLTPEERAYAQEILDASYSQSEE